MMDSPADRVASVKSAPLALSGRLGLDRKRVHRAPELAVKRSINHAVAFDPALPFEGCRYNIDPEMRLTARPVAGVTLMQMRFVLDFEAFGDESFAQLVRDNISGGHGSADYVAQRGFVNRAFTELKVFAMSRLEAFRFA
jgi:hypothetical protein